MRIVLDGVFNHASRGFFQFNHILEAGRQVPLPGLVQGEGLPSPRLRGQTQLRLLVEPGRFARLQSRQTLRCAISFSDVARYWIEQGIDGWRLDVPFEIDDDSFWQEFRQVVKTPIRMPTSPVKSPGMRPLAARRPVRRGDELPADLRLLGFLRRRESRISNWSDTGAGMTASYFVLGRRQLSASVPHELLTKYPRPAVLAQLNLLDSHDTARFLSISGSKDRLAPGNPLPNDLPRRAVRILRQ